MMEVIKLFQNLRKIEVSNVSLNPTQNVSQFLDFFTDFHGYRLMQSALQIIFRQTLLMSCAQHDV